MIRGTERKYEPQHIEISRNVNIHNRFDIEVRDAKTNQLKQKAQAFNVICNNFWAYIDNYFNYIVYGNGIGTPSPSDTTLFGTWNYASASNHDDAYDIKNGVSHRTRKIVLSETTAVGMTITEVGLAYSTSSKSLCTHAMIQDMNGNHISIKKTDTDILTIYATVYAHFVPTGYEDGTIIIPPTQGAIRYCLGNGYYFGSVRVGKGTCKMPKTISSNVSVKYDATYRTLTCTAPRLTVNSCNLEGGFGWIMMGDESNCACLIDVRDKYEITGEAVGAGDGSTTEFATLFDFPSNAIVYVDGVPKISGVTVKNEPVSTDPFQYLVRMHPVLCDGKPVFWGGRVPLYYNTDVYFYNTRSELGFYQWSDYHYAYMGMRISFSDDFVNWSDFYGYGTVVPEQYRYCKYLKMRGDSTSSTHAGHTDIQTGVFPPSITGKNIVFDTPPDAGSIITIDYTTPFVPKDSSHVYDLSLIIRLGEYSGS